MRRGEKEAQCHASTALAPSSRGRTGVADVRAPPVGVWCGGGILQGRLSFECGRPLQRYWAGPGARDGVGKENGAGPTGAKREKEKREGRGGRPVGLYWAAQASLPFSFILVFLFHFLFRFSSLFRVWLKSMKVIRVCVIVEVKS